MDWSLHAKYCRCAGNHHRFAQPGTCRNFICLAGDATANCISCINWPDRADVRFGPGDLLNAFNGRNESDAIIYDIELAPSICGLSTCASICTEEIIAAVGIDNANVPSWIRRGRARRGRARRMLAASPFVAPNMT